MTTTDPNAPQWTPEQVLEARRQGREQDIIAARDAGQLDDIMNGA